MSSRQSRSRRVLGELGTDGKEKLSKATRHAILAHLKRFFQWLAQESGYRSRLTYSNADYFNLSEKDTRVANARRGLIVLVQSCIADEPELVFVEPNIGELRICRLLWSESVITPLNHASSRITLPSSECNVLRRLAPRCRQ